MMGCAQISVPPSSRRTSRLLFSILNPVLSLRFAGNLTLRKPAEASAAQNVATVADVVNSAGSPRFTFASHLRLMSLEIGNDLTRRYRVPILTSSHSAPYDLVITSIVLELEFYDALEV
jgi:hypothetical protein